MKKQEDGAVDHTVPLTIVIFCDQKVFKKRQNEERECIFETWSIQQSAAKRYKAAWTAHAFEKTQNSWHVQGLASSEDLSFCIHATFY